MMARTVGIVGTILVAMAVGAPAWAFSDQSGDDSAAAAVQQDAPPPADYRYSGNGFNVSMSRDPSRPGAAEAADGPQPQPARPGFFGRILRSIFGDD